ncbi:MAG: SpoIIIAH-like family protein [Clostridia bacterium]|nr:SpoIIIAH-like family protein [Clostridia bacterium]
MIILHKKRILACILGTMLVIAGILNYNDKSLEVSGDILDNEAESTFVTNMKENIETIDVDSSNLSDSYFVSARREKNDTYDKQVKYQEEILYNEKSSETIKTAALNRINTIVDKMSKEMAIEKLLEAKGFSEVLAIINDDNVNVIVKTMEELSISQVAQIQSIVMREANVKADSIHVITKN